MRGGGKSQSEARARQKDGGSGRALSERAAREGLREVEWRPE